MKLIDLRMADGTRHFGSLPQEYDAHAPQWHRVRDRASALKGAALTRFLTDDVAEAWIDFTWRGHAFSVNNQQGDWWFFVADPACPDELLSRVLEHFEVLLDPLVARARGGGRVASGHYRVLVLEPDGRVGHQDFAVLADAQVYAADCRYEAEDDRGSPLAYVFDAGLKRVP